MYVRRHFFDLRMQDEIEVETDGGQWQSQLVKVTKGKVAEVAKVAEVTEVVVAAHKIWKRRIMKPDGGFAAKCTPSAFGSSPEGGAKISCRSLRGGKRTDFVRSRRRLRNQ